MKLNVMWVVLVLTVMAAIPASAEQLNDWLETADWRSWDRVQEFGGPDDKGTDLGSGGGTFLSGRKLKAAGLSALVPGMGQLYNGQRTKGLIMVGMEAAVWGAYVGFHKHAGRLSDDYRNWAEIYAQVRPGDHADAFYQAVGRYDDSWAWHDSRLREARAFGNAAPSAPGDFSTWQWRSEQHRTDYQILRADANSAYDRRDMMLLFAAVNRAVSIFDAIRNGGDPAGVTGDSQPTARVLGADVNLAVSAPLMRPQALASASWSF